MCLCFKLTPVESGDIDISNIAMRIGLAGLAAHRIKNHTIKSRLTSS